MKIHQLPDGARFEYEGEQYVKTGPLFATGKGGQRLIPKYALLKPIDATGIASETKDGALPKVKILKALDVFVSECRALVPDERQAALDEARERFFKAIA